MVPDVRIEAVNQLNNAMGTVDLLLLSTYHMMTKGLRWMLIFVLLSHLIRSCQMLGTMEEGPRKKLQCYYFYTVKKDRLSL